MSRCVRRAFLCGFDALSKKNFDHRKEWARDRVKFLTAVFCLDVLAYAIMSNHLHVLVRVRPDDLARLSDSEVARRWLLLYPKRTKWGVPACEPAIEDVRTLAADCERVQTLRGRLGSISWFMKSLNEVMARRANAEDDCKGRFWEGRFKCQRVEDLGAVLTCSVYVDLNPIRAGIASTPEDSAYTSAWERIEGLEKKEEAVADPGMGSRGESRSDEWLAPLPSFLPLDLPQYLSILDWTGRELRRDKRGSIPEHLAPILDRLGINAERWVDAAEHYGSWFYQVVGRAESMAAAARTAGRRWFKGRAAARKLFGPADSSSLVSAAR